MASMEVRSNDDTTPYPFENSYTASHRLAAPSA